MAVRKKSKRKAKKAKPGERVYIAGRRMNLSRGGGTVVVMGGELVPEFADFKNLPNYLRTGHVICLVDGQPIRESLRHIGRIQKSPAWLHFNEKKAKGTQIASNKKASAARAGGRKSKAEAGGRQPEKSDAGTAAKVSKKKAQATTKKASKKKATAKAPKRKTGGKKTTRRRRRGA